MKSHGLIVLIVGAGLFTGAATRAAGQDKTWVGESVLPKKPTKHAGYLPNKVRDEHEGWLHIHDGRDLRWVDKANFVLVRDAPTYFHQLVQANPKDAWAL